MCVYKNKGNDFNQAGRKARARASERLCPAGRVLWLWLLLLLMLLAASAAERRQCAFQLALAMDVGMNDDP